MPIVGLLTGDFTQKFIALDGHYDTLMPLKKGTAVITYGNLLQATINFVIIALFVLILRAAEK
jgi:large conductance mechanosensitive channel